MGIRSSADVRYQIMMVYAQSSEKHIATVKLLQFEIFRGLVAPYALRQLFHTFWAIGLLLIQRGSRDISKTNLLRQLFPALCLSTGTVFNIPAPLVPTKT